MKEGRKERVRLGICNATDADGKIITNFVMRIAILMIDSRRNGKEIENK